MSTYPTTDTYPHYVFVRGLRIGWVNCGYCGLHVFLDDRGRLEPHDVLDESPKRWCEGGNRFYHNLYGTRSVDETWKSFPHES